MYIYIYIIFSAIQDFIEGITRSWTVEGWEFGRGVEFF